MYCILLQHDVLVGLCQAVATTLRNAIMRKEKDMVICITVLWSDFYRGNTIIEAYKRFGDLKTAITPIF
jgi:hypothetical protein